MPSGYQEESRYDESRPLYYSPKEPSSEYSQALALTVVFTTVSGTLTALRKAAQLAHELGARIQVLVAYVVPYPLAIDRPRVDPEFRFRRFLTLCEQGPIESRVDIRLCRDARRCIQDALLPHSLIVIGGRQGWWPLGREKRLARELTRAGHQVIFVGHSRLQ